MTDGLNFWKSVLNDARRGIGITQIIIRSAQSFLLIDPQNIMERKRAYSKSAGPKRS
jgi:hypothetical protein